VAHLHQPCSIQIPLAQEPLTALRLSRRDSDATSAAYCTVRVRVEAAAFLGNFNSNTPFSYFACACS